MAIYTKRGDGGKTALLNSKKERKKLIYKDTLKLDVLGTIDELNSFLGVAITFSNTSETTSLLKDIQEDLLTISSIIAGEKFYFGVTNTKKSEKMIDKFEKALPPLRNFILPGGTVFAAHLHYARSLARRVERCAVSLSKKESVSKNILAYLNRLSDALFIMARYVNYEAKVNEEVWSKSKRK